MMWCDCCVVLCWYVRLYLVCGCVVFVCVMLCLLQCMCMCMIVCMMVWCGDCCVCELRLVWVPVLFVVVGVWVMLICNDMFRLCVC